MASAWKIYDAAKKKIGNGTINLSADQFYLAILSTGAAATISASARSTWASLSAAAISAGGVTKSGKALTATWSAGASAGEQRFDATAVIFSASGAALSNVQYAVIWVSGGDVLCWSKLSTSAFDVTDGNTLTITPSANGIFELN